ncbi:tyrosine-protein kinase family protein [uncultured Dokdonia sp.]|uniref:GumC family protein n=1 Tax=uncultured Dokdonia sp. TaxID=575653 RepID=UPI002602F7CC|nr:tyrosine-protein kinase family protein [uncultured Dokdonia sp.]
MKETNKITGQEEINIKDQIQQYLQYWPWFILSLIICYSSAWFYLRYSTYSYVTEATILIKDDNNASLSEIAIFEDLGLTGSGLNVSEFENEIELLRSRSLLASVVENLNSNISYYKEGNIKTSEIYEDLPFTIDIIDKSFINDENSTTFYVEIQLDDNSFNFKEGEQGIAKSHKFGETFSTRKLGNVALNKKALNSKNIDIKGNYLIHINSVEKAVNKLRSTINIQSVSKNSSILKLSLVYPEKKKAEITLNTIIDAYNTDAIKDRNLISKNTADFIVNRLAIITKELDSVETNKVVFKEDNNVTDLETEGKLFIENSNELNKQQIEIATQKQLLESMLEYLKSSEQYSLLPSNLGVQNSNISQSINDYNELILTRQRLLRSSTEANPVVLESSSKIVQSKENIRENIKTVILSLDIEIKDLRKQQSRVGGKISQIPSISKSSRDIERQQTIKETLYLYLLQKREETAISLAVTTPKAKIVDRAYSLNAPISPKPKIIYLASIILGLLVPFGIFFIKKIFDTKIHNRIDLEKEIPSLPILGEIPIIESKESEVIKNNDRSVLAEAFRILRTNLSYFIKAKENGNVIFVTSTIKGEGKTFVAYNLAITLTSTGKSVLLIGADVRNPQIHRYIDKNEWTIGLSEYLYDSSVDVASITNRTETEGQDFDVILSGRIPPNPAELLMSERFENIIEEVRGKYDYVIVDTAPTLLVTDTLLISQLADTTVYVCRAEYTDKKLLQYPKELYEEGKLKNIAFAINGIKITNFGYGSKYGYGYGYGQEQPSVFNRIKRLLRLKK